MSGQIFSAISPHVFHILLEFHLEQKQKQLYGLEQVKTFYEKIVKTYTLEYTKSTLFIFF